jgi:hypothetical protein
LHSAASSVSSLLGKITDGKEVNANNTTCSAVRRAAVRALCVRARSPSMAATHGSSSMRTWCSRSSNNSERRRRNAA